MKPEFETLVQVGRIKELVYKHKLIMNPALWEEEILQLEKKLGIPLPEGYRWFLHEIGDGGLGPYHGLNSMQNSSIVTSTDGKEQKRLQLCHEGGGYYFSLVLNGEDEGLMYHEYPDANEIIKIGYGFGEHIVSYTFLDWYEHWLKAGAKATKQLREFMKNQ